MPVFEDGVQTSSISATHEDDAKTGQVPSAFFSECRAADIRQANVSDQDVDRRAGFNIGDRRLRVGRLLDDMAEVAEHVARREANHRLILHEEDAEGFCVVLGRILARLKHRASSSLELLSRHVKCPGGGMSLLRPAFWVKALQASTGTTEFKKLPRLKSII
ncbi:hypothetical protein CHELA41_22973 [Hyphomicrobiales bacterium]|nr:hypothetical protein CHELA41_22973 [Hyphomicrobiales bacterium]